MAVFYKRVHRGQYTVYLGRFTFFANNKKTSDGILESEFKVVLYFDAYNYKVKHFCREKSSSCFCKIIEVSDQCFMSVKSQVEDIFDL